MKRQTRQYSWAAVGPPSAILSQPVDVRRDEKSPWIAIVSAVLVCCLQGYPGFSASGLAGLVAPAGTPVEAINRLNAEVVKLLKQPKVIEQCLTLGLDPVGDTPAEFAQFIRTDMDKWSRLTRELNLNME